MGLGKAITAEERGRIAAYNDQGMSIRDIAGKLHRSKTMVGALKEVMITFLV